MLPNEGSLFTWRSGGKKVKNERMVGTHNPQNFEPRVYLSLKKRDVGVANQNLLLRNDDPCISEADQAK